MSFSLLVNQGRTQNSRPISNQTSPFANQAKTLPFLVPLASAATAELDLTNPQTQGVIDQIQSVYIDNSDNTSEFSITTNNGQNVTCPASTQGWFPLLSANPPVFQFASLGAVDVPIFFCNVPMPLGTWLTDRSRVSQALPLTSFSVVSDAVAGSYQLMPADAFRGYVVIKAPETEDLWINPVGGTASVGGLDCFKIAMGGTYESLTEAWPGQINYRSNGTAVNITAFSG